MEVYMFLYPLSSIALPSADLSYMCTCELVICAFKRINSLELT